MTKTIVLAASSVAIAGVTAVLLLAVLGIAESIALYAIWAVAAITIAAIGVARAYARRGK